MKDSQNKKVFTQMLNQAEFKALLEFFTTELPKLAL
jgi:hypothetical protein